MICSKTLLKLSVCGVLCSPILAEEMLASEESVKDSGSPGWKTAMQALRDDNNEILKLVVSSNNDVVNDVVGSSSLLKMAAYKGKIDAVKVLVNNGADPNIGNGLPLLGVLNGMDPLMGGVSRKLVHRYMKVMHYLLEEGATFNNRPYAVNDVSLAEAYIMSLCEQDGYSDVYVEVLDKYDFDVSVGVEYRSSYKHIAELTKEKYVSEGVGYDPDCVSYMFDSMGGGGLSKYW